jgi:S1-C subfamily serine protease
VRKVLFFLWCCVLLSGCSSATKGIIAYSRSDEVFYADLAHDLASGVAVVKAENKDGVLCSGTSTVRRLPWPSVGCTGQRGDIFMNCSDGRTIVGYWQAESCSTGNGWAKDTRGRQMVFFFGRDVATLEARAGLDTKKPKDGPRPVASGTGFFITTDGLLATNEHVVHGGRAFEVHFPKTGRKFKATLLHKDAENDIALLKIETDTVPIPLALRFDAKRGEEVMTLGYPLTDLQGKRQKATFGRVNASTGFKDDVRFVQIDVPIQSGNSGGPLIDTRGEVIGLVTSSIVQDIAQDVHYAVKIDYLYPMLRDTDYKPQKKSTKQLSMVELAELYEQSVVRVIRKE